MTSRFRRFLRRFHRIVNLLSYFLRADHEFLLFVWDEVIVLVLALLARAILESGDAVSMAPIVEPLALVLEAVRPLANAGA